jgi:hypothetical protein
VRHGGGRNKKQMEKKFPRACAGGAADEGQQCGF